MGKTVKLLHSRNFHISFVDKRRAIGGTSQQPSTNEAAAFFIWANEGEG